jgi:DNA polymerase I-like protein with 3'-5' exonuclease and polymerase domains
MIDELIQGRDPHAASCSELMELPITKENRNGAKIFNFRAVYADLETAAYAYYMDPKMPSFSQTKWNQIITNWTKKYYGMVKAHEEWVYTVYKTGQLRGPTGRVWVFDKVEKTRRGVIYKDYSKAQIYNYPTQGTSGDVIRLALVESMRRIRAKKLPVLFINTVHDSLIFDGPTYEVLAEAARIIITVFREIPALMKKYFKWDLSVPIDGEANIGHNWKDMKEIIV